MAVKIENQVLQEEQSENGGEEKDEIFNNIR